MAIHTRILLIASVLMMAFTFSPFSVAAKPEPTPVEQTKIKVNINSADADLLADALVGVGMSKAKAIVSYRKANGKFKKAEDLTLVKGIGTSIVEKNKARITL